MNRIHSIRKIWGHPVFAAGVLILLLNDCILKEAFHNAITGKLSDVAGLLVFPAFLVALWPRLHKWIYVFTALFFIWWKLQYSQPAIDFVNNAVGISLGRTVDVSDLWALLVLPLSYWLFIVRPQRPWWSALSNIATGVIAFIAFCATSVPYRYTYYKPVHDSNEHGLFYVFSTRKSSEAVLQRLDSLSLLVVHDSVQYETVYDASTPSYPRGPVFIGTRDSVISGYGRILPLRKDEALYHRTVLPKRYKVYQLPVNGDTIEALRFELYPEPNGKTSVTLRDIWLSPKQTNTRLSNKARKKFEHLIRSSRLPR